MQYREVTFTFKITKLISLEDQQYPEELVEAMWEGYTEHISPRDLALAELIDVDVAIEAPDWFEENDDLTTED